ncbi:MAG: ABC transporter substrate-binding protein [Dehalococcoidia bacterium]
MKGLLLRLLTLGALATAACAPAAPAPTQPTTGGAAPAAPTEQRADQQLLKIGVSGLIGNPTPQSSSSNLYQFWPMYDNLTQFGANYEVKPSVAEKWTISDDAKTWTFSIRKDMKWPDGSALTAEDVAFTINEIVAKNWPQRAFIGFVTEAKVVDPATVEVLTKQEDASIPNAGPYLWIVPKAYYQSVGFDGFVQKPMGSGPYELTSFKVADTLSYKKRTAAHAFRKPVADEVIFRAIPESTQVVNGLTTGELDIAAQVNFTGDQIDQIKRNNLPIISNLSATGGAGLLQGVYEKHNTPLKDKRVRQAFNYAVDKQAIADGIYRGYAKPSGQLAVPGSLYWDDSVQPYPYDPAMAKRLLAEAGYPNGFKLPSGIDFTPGMTRPDLVIAIQGYLKAVGVEAEANSWELGVFVDKRYGRNNQTNGDISVGGSGDGNGFNSQARTFNGCGKPVGGNAESLGYCNPEWDRLMDAAFGEKDPVKRGQLMKQANKVFRDDVPVIFLTSNPIYVIHTPKTKAVELAMPLAYNFDSAYKIK